MMIVGLPLREIGAICAGNLCVAEGNPLHPLIPPC